MKLTSKIQYAIEKASELHLGQKRKEKGLPFIIHPFSVAFILSEYTDNEDIICGGLLHDVLEDVAGYNYEDLARDFGEEIARIVDEVSEDKDTEDSDEKAKETWNYQKQKYIDDLKHDSMEALMVSAGDKIHNIQAMLSSHQEKGEEMWEVFSSPKPKRESTIWFYDEVFKVLKERLDNDILKEYETVLTELKKLV